MLSLHSFHHYPYVFVYIMSTFFSSVNLSTLNGRNGFVINGIDEGDFSGRTVSSAGDVNGDGNDLLFGGSGFNFLYGGTTSGGGSGRDIFALTEGDGLDIIFDFNVGEDAIALTSGLEFGGIYVVQVDDDTVIGTTAGDVMAVIENVNASDLGRPTFLSF